MSETDFDRKGENSSYQKVLEVVDENLSKTTRDNILNSELSLIKGIVLEEKRRCVMISIIEG